MIKALQKVLKVKDDGVAGPKTLAALLDHPLAVEWFKFKQPDARKLAYVFATAWHETAFTLQPVSEYGGEAYLKSKKYYPFYGRGYVQLTWEENYKKYDIEQNPDQALEPSLAAFIAIDGMLKGVFTGKKLSDYFNASTEAPLDARRIINGLDRAQQIAGYYEGFFKHS